MPIEQPRLILQGAKALITGIANEHSIAYGCAKAFHELGAELALTDRSERLRAGVSGVAEAMRAVPAAFASCGREKKRLHASGRVLGQRPSDAQRFVIRVRRQDQQPVR